ncbi:MAG: TetR/AcrR family transcriptional regulator [Saprospiraceae bacterium]|nr:TetR/AcrR family transcriptional regulator [Saprospiraceae bacterium]
MARLSKEDWLEEGFKILKEFAQDKLRILYLCQRLKVTRGSFYHHFSSIENYVASLMQRWEKENTRQYIDLANQKSGAQDKMNVLNDLILQQDHAIEAAIRSWGFYQPLVKEYLDRVDQLRVGYLEEIFIGKGYDKKEASIMAELEYALLIGVQHRYPGKFGKRVRALYLKYAQMVEDDLK